jgi:S-adenosylmethionine:tRNA ribosyltransferase-isomerase
MLSPSDFFYPLPECLIAQKPAKPRDHSRLMILNRSTTQINHSRFDQLSDLLSPDDVLVFNQSKVFPARLLGRKPTGGQIEILLVSPKSGSVWQAIASPHPRPLQNITFASDFLGRVIDQSSELIEIEFNCFGKPLLSQISRYGHTPIPPYIHPQQTETQIRQSYQTVYASTVGSCAAPTAGLHFTTALLDRLKKRGVQLEYLTLHVGLGTFQKLRPQNLQTSTLHPEIYDIDQPTFSRLLQAKDSGKRIIAVGTTTTRTLETVFRQGLSEPGPLTGSTNLFIYPPYRFNFVDSLITNFHLPESSLLMLVSAFASSPNTSHSFSTFASSSVGQAYLAALNHQYCFFSFGDAMWIHS